jgi:hypothetical protein
VLLLAAAAPVAGAGGVAGPGWQAHRHLRATAGLAGQLHQELARGQLPQARQTLLALQERARAARAATTGPGWRLGRRLPGIGPDLTAAGTVAAALDDLAHRGLPLVVELAGDLDPAGLAPRDGRVDLAPLRRAAPRVAAAAAAVRQARDRVAAIPTRGLLPPLRSAITELTGQLARAAAGIGAVAQAGRLLPPMLGGSSPRSYLLLFQNPAELRATGGMPGAFAVVRADRGALRIVDQGTAAADLGTFDRPVLPGDPAVRGLYPDRLGSHPADINLSPHFPTAAELAREMYRRRSGRTVDGVLATDPVALSYLLRATGPVRLPSGGPGAAGGWLTADNAVRLLLSDAYATGAPGPAQDAYLASVAAAAFDALVAGGADPRAAAAGLARAAAERRVLLWSAHPAEQRLVAGTALAGVLPTRAGRRLTVGVFLNDGSGAKLGYYLTQAARLEHAGCRPDGRRELRLRVTLGSTAPPVGLPAPVLGLGLAGDPYTIRTNVSVFSPVGGAVVGVRRDGVPVPVGTGLERGRAVGLLTVDAPPGGSTSVEVTLLTGVLPAGGTVSARLVVTPAATSWERLIGSFPSCRTNQ